MVKDIMRDVEELMKEIKTVDDAVNIALTMEKQGQDFYLEKAGTSTSIAAKDLYVYLAAEEERHIEYLDDFKKTGNASAICAINTPDFTPSFVSEFSGENPGEMDVLLGALRFEQKSENFYKELAAWTDDHDLREFFDMIASFEHRHLELIDGFIENATQFRMQT